jgi:deoxyribodipyrimidine photolyase
MYKHDIYVAHPFSFPHSTPNFDKMIDNPIARQIPWDDDPDLLLAWKMSKTGYPYIDAIMTQLRETGWIHHLARHSVACFLTRGDLWQSWEDGATVFEEYLIDADWSINNFNWQWLSCTAQFYQVRVYKCLLSFIHVFALSDISSKTSCSSVFSMLFANCFR